jgi:hypothetical protein
MRCAQAFPKIIKPIMKLLGQVTMVFFQGGGGAIRYTQRLSLLFGSTKELK